MAVAKAREPTPLLGPWVNPERPWRCAFWRATAAWTLAGSGAQAAGRLSPRPAVTDIPGREPRMSLEPPRLFPLEHVHAASGWPERLLWPLLRSEQVRAYGGDPNRPEAGLTFPAVCGLTVARLLDDGRVSFGAALKLGAQSLRLVEELMAGVTDPGHGKRQDAWTGFLLARPSLTGELFHLRLVLPAMVGRLVDRMALIVDLGRLMAETADGLEDAARAGGNS